MSGQTPTIIIIIIIKAKTYTQVKCIGAYYFAYKVINFNIRSVVCYIASENKLLKK